MSRLLEGSAVFRDKNQKSLSGCDNVSFFVEVMYLEYLVNSQTRETFFTVKDEKLIFLLMWNESRYPC